MAPHSKHCSYRQYLPTDQFLGLLDIKRKVLGSYKTLFTVYQSPPRNTKENLKLHHHRCENLAEITVLGSALMDSSEEQSYVT
jgi:hypothetical protein